MILSKRLLISPYKPNEVIAEITTAGTPTVTLKTSGVYEIEAISGGAGGTVYDTLAAVIYLNTGSTGAYYRGKINIPAGTYTIKVGAGGRTGAMSAGGAGGQTSIGNIFVLRGAGATGTSSTGTVGSLTSISGEVERIQYAIGKSGGSYPNYGTMHDPWHGDVSCPAVNYGFNSSYGKGGHAIYTDNGYDLGAGGSGYLKITYKGR